MNDKLKGLLIGVGIGSLVTGATAFAAGGKMIEVFYNVNDIKVNQISKMPEGDLQPFLYKGSTFVPLAFMSDALGQPVKWDAKNKTVLIGENGDEFVSYPGKDINPIETQSGSYYNSHSVEYGGESIKDNNGNEHANYHTYVFAANTDNWIYNNYNLNGEYKSFVAKVGLLERYKNSLTPVTLTVTVDGKKAYAQEFKAGDVPVEIKLDLEKAVSLQFKVSTANGIDMSGLGIFDGYFIK
ncbi:stalk domain-containing protein [Paenibacillus pabuli]|uniref:stalk domain-containing protein n=1 Tax=Paenibacillus pabuli TaxID=1472 RepID=UPI003459EC55